MLQYLTASGSVPATSLAPRHPAQRITVPASGPTDLAPMFVRAPPFEAENSALRAGVVVGASGGKNLAPVFAGLEPDDVPCLPENEDLARSMIAYKVAVLRAGHVDAGHRMGKVKDAGMVVDYIRRCRHILSDAEVHNFDKMVNGAGPETADRLSAVVQGR